MNIFEKIKFILGRPKVVIVAGENSQVTAEIISRVLESHFKIGLHPPSTLPSFAWAPEVLVFGSDLENLEKIKFLIGRSSLPVLVATKYNEKIRELARVIPTQGFLVLNSDEKELEEIKNGSTAHCLTFGFREKDNFQASDVKENSRINFKISCDGKVVPVWLEKSTDKDKDKISSALAAATVGTIFGLNLVEISQSLQSS